MRVDRGRAVLLAMLVAVAGVVPGSGAVAGAAPAGFTIACEAGTFPGAPRKLDDTLVSTGNGECIMTGDFGADWEMRLTVRVQVKTAGVWRTRALAISSLYSGAGTKRIRKLQAGYSCQGSTSRKWRTRTTVQALANEKVVVTLESASESSAAASRSC